MVKKYKYTTIITFKAITGDRRIVRKNIPIHHNFEVIPSQEYMGVTLPPTSVEEQVIHFLDEQDKTALMEKYDFYLIIDYYPKKKRKNKVNEFEEFKNFITPIFNQFPVLKRPFEAIISESKDVLFGKGKSNEEKLKEVMNSHSMILKGLNGMLTIFQKMCNKSLENGNYSIQEALCSDI